MSSSEAKSSRRFLWWGLFLVLLVGGYSAGWYVIAGKVEERVDATIDRLAAKDVVADCENRTVRGFPLGLGLYCDGLNYEDAARGISFTTGALRTAAQVYRPFQAAAELDGPLQVESPDFPPLLVDWDSLRATVRVARPVPESISVEAKGLSAITDPDNETDPANIFDAAEAQANLHPDGADIDWAGGFKGLKINPDVIDGRDIPLLDGSGEAKIANGVAMLADRPRSLRGQSATIQHLTLTSGTGGVTVSGPVSVDNDGLIDANLRVTIKDPAALGAVLKQAVPEHASEIQTGLAGIAFFGKDPSVPLKIVKGRATFMGFTIAEIKPLGG